MHVPIVLMRSHHTFCDAPYEMIVAGSWLMFGDPFDISYLANFIELFDNLQKVLLVDISDGIFYIFLFL